MRTIDSIMTLKDHSTFKFVNSSRFPRQSKDELFVFKMYIDLPSNHEAYEEDVSRGGT